MCKKILIITISLMVAVSGFLTGFFSVGLISVYAIDDDVLWQPLNSENELVDAFQDYCKSRDLTIEGSVADAVTTATTGSFNGICNRLGIDITALQADIKKSTDQAGNVQWLFNSNGITAYNRIFSQFLQDNELEVGSPADKSLYSGEYGTDLNGNGFLFYVIPRNPVNGRNYRPIVHGSTYIYNNQTMVDLAIHNNDRYQFNPFGSGSNNYMLVAKQYNQWRLSNASGISKFISGSNSNSAYAGNLGIAYMSGYTSDIRIGLYTSDDDYFYDFGSISIANQQSVNITIISPTINNNTYEGDTIINNEGDIIINPTPEPTPEPNDPNDTIHNVPESPLTPNPDGGWDIDLPDIDIPNLPIGNLSEKFPFSIPWDLVAFYAMLDAEPQAPRFNGTMDLTLVQWNYDIDLAPFDSAAELCRKLQFGLFVVGLIVASRSIIRG